jgi:hypothetical protein
VAEDEQPEADEAEPATPAPVLTWSDVRPPRRPGVDRGTVWAQLAIIVLLAVLLAGAVGRVELDRIADDGWQDNALWAVGTAVVLLGLALAAVATTLASTSARGVMARVTILAATIGVVAAVIVVGLADVNGGEVAASSVPATAIVRGGGNNRLPADATPVTPADALSPENLAPSSLPIPERTTVTISLTVVGRQLMARAMGCQPNDFVGRSLVGAAIGGTWAEPLLVPNAPFDADGNSVDRCHTAVVRLPIDAGTIRPGI